MIVTRGFSNGTISASYSSIVLMGYNIGEDVTWEIKQPVITSWSQQANISTTWTSQPVTSTEWSIKQPE